MAHVFSGMVNTREIGQYQLRRELGRTGMSTVCLGYDIRFRRYVAIKVLHPQLLEDPSFIIRFRHEARVIASLEHHAIVPVYDFGQHEDLPYLVMRYMAGGTLREQLQRGPMPFSEICHILDRVASALDKAHSRGIIHRDIKTANVLFDEDGEPYLSDFGSARIMASTETGSFVGTPPYMAPEQWTGEKIDERTDVYQLGAMLFEMMTGRVPFEADTPPALMHKHIHAAVPSARAYNPRLPAACDAVVRKAMAKKQADRYSSSGELATAARSAFRSGQALPDELRVRRPGVNVAQSIMGLTSALKRLPKPFWFGLGGGLLLFLVLLAVMASSWSPFQARATTTPTVPAQTPVTLTPVGNSPTPSRSPTPIRTRPAATLAPTETNLPVARPTETLPPSEGTSPPTPTRVPTKTPRPTATWAPPSPTTTPTT